MVGIIGGTDGPTAIIATSNLTAADTIPALMFLAASIGVMILARWLYRWYQER